MPTFEVIWLPRALQKLADNDVTPEQFEHVVRTAGLWKQASHRETRPVVVELGDVCCSASFEFIDELRILPVTAFWIHED
jgi:hypothetical protein